MKLSWILTSQLFASIDASCCKHVLVKNARIGERIYTHNDRYVNGRPMYEDAHKVRALWYNDGAWKSGYFDALYPTIAHTWPAAGDEPQNTLTGNFDSAYMSSGEDTECPDQVTTWKTESDLTLEQPAVFGDVIPLSKGEEDADVPVGYKPLAHDFILSYLDLDFLYMSFERSNISPLLTLILIVILYSKEQS